VDIGGSSVADDKVAKVSFSPRLTAEGQFAVQPAEFRAVLEDENRDPMFAEFKQELSAGALLEIGDASADQLERRVA
jgi:hypothetical protein